MNRPGTEYNLAGVMLRRAQLSPERRALVFEEQESPTPNSPTGCAARPACCARAVCVWVTGWATWA